MFLEVKIWNSVNRGPPWSCAMLKRVGAKQWRFAPLSCFAPLFWTFVLLFIGKFMVAIGTLNILLSLASLTLFVRSWRLGERLSRPNQKKQLRRCKFIIISLAVFRFIYLARDARWDLKFVTIALTGICRLKLVRNKIKSGKKPELVELIAGGTGRMARGKGQCADCATASRHITFQTFALFFCLSLFCDSGPTFIKPPKIQKEEDKRQVQWLTRLLLFFHEL